MDTREQIQKLSLEEKAALLQKLPEIIRPGDCLLVKASHSMALGKLAAVSRETAGG